MRKCHSSIFKRQLLIWIPGDFILTRGDFQNGSLLQMYVHWKLYTKKHNRLFRDMNPEPSDFYLKFSVSWSSSASQTRTWGSCGLLRPISVQTSLRIRYPAITAPESNINHRVEMSQVRFYYFGDQSALGRPTAIFLEQLSTYLVCAVTILWD